MCYQRPWVDNRKQRIMHSNIHQTETPESRKSAENWPIPSLNSLLRDWDLFKRLPHSPQISSEKVNLQRRAFSTLRLIPSCKISKLADNVLYKRQAPDRPESTGGIQSPLITREKSPQPRFQYSHHHPPPSNTDKKVNWEEVDLMNCLIRPWSQASNTRSAQTNDKQKF